MKRFLTFLALLLTFSVSAQTFQVATQIIASPDCKLKFLNKIDSQIYEVNSVDMTWQYLTTTTIKIKDYDNEVTVYKNNMTSPVFADIPALLDSVQGACMGGSGGGGIQSIVPGTNITVDDTDPQNPIVSSTGGGGSDSTIYKTDGSTPDNRTAEFKGGLNLKSDNVIKNNVGNYNYITNTRGFAFASNSDSILLVDSIFGAYYKNIRNPMLNTELVPKWYVDSVAGGGGIAGVEHINGKDGDLKIIAGSNVTIDNSKPDTIVISSSGGDYEAGYGILINENTIDVNLDEVITVNGNSEETQIYGNLYLSEYSLIQIGGSYLSQNQIILIDDAGNGMLMAGGEMGGGYPGGKDFVLNPDGLSFNHKIDHDSLDGNDVPQKWYVDSVAGGGGAYLPLNITDSTGVDLNGHSLIFQGQNHSLALNRPYDALSIGGAVMDGFQAQQYDSIYTMNGLMKAQGFFGDTTRYPVMFMSLGMPMSANFKAVMFKPEFDNNGFRFLYNLFDSEGTMLNYVMGTEGIVILDNGTPMLSLGVDGIVKASAYIEDKTANSYAQMQDLARTRIDDPTDGYLVNPSTRDVVVIIKTDSTDLTLPDIADCEFWNLYVINKSTTTTTLRTVSNESVFWDGTTVTGSHDCVGGAITHVIFDGENYSTK